MKVLIIDFQYIDEKCFVLFQSKLGSGKALWYGDSPVVNNEYHVEIEIHDNLLWGNNILSSLSRKYNIESVNDDLILTGKIESIDNDGYTVIRLDESIVCIEAIGKPFPLGAFVDVYTKDVELFNLNYL